jgi:hypothetical protein
MQIIIWARNGAEILAMPVAPTGLQVPITTYNMDEFPSFVGDLTLPGTPKLRDLEWTSVMPVTQEYWMHGMSTPDPQMYIDTIQRWCHEKIPIRVIITSKRMGMINMACTVREFTFETLTSGMVRYYINLREYKFAQARSV